jgi:anion-transporting  ArsA/GET3 family ATPase
MLDILNDPARTGLVVVTTPEEMPVTETIELLDQVAATTSVDVAAVIANRVLPLLFNPAEAVLFDRMLADAPQAVLRDAVGPAITTLFDAAGLAAARQQVGSAHLQRLRDRLPRHLPLIALPELFTRASGRRAVALLTEALGDELL